MDEKGLADVQSERNVVFQFLGFLQGSFSTEFPNRLSAGQVEGAQHQFAEALACGQVGDATREVDKLGRALGEAPKALGGRELEKVLVAIVSFFEFAGEVQDVVGGGVVVDATASRKAPLQLGHRDGLEVHLHSLSIRGMSLEVSPELLIASERRMDLHTLTVECLLERILKMETSSDESSRQPPERLLPQIELPGQPYWPGNGPRPELVGPDPWPWGIDLFNHGFYWEAHEVWEELWQASQKQSPQGLALRGLIQAAAACLKSRQGNLRGVEILSQRATATLLRSGLDEWQGISLLALVDGLARLPLPPYLRPAPNPTQTTLDKLSPPPYSRPSVCRGGGANETYLPTQKEDS